MWTTTDVEHWLFDQLSDDDEVTSARSFAAAGLMTRDRGLVLRFASGLEIQLTIVRSANPTNEDEANQ